MLHIDNEGGLVHIAACLGTTSVVIFGPTSADYFAYLDNINVRPPVCGDCWWTTKNWMDICPLGHKQPLCMYEQTPLAIMNAISQHWMPHHQGRLQRN
jgi:ADP-heptose:LPS heptosyltransferase